MGCAQEPAPLDLNAFDKEDLREKEEEKIEKGICLQPTKKKKKDGPRQQGT